MIPPGFRVDHHPVVTSTQDTAKDRLHQAGWSPELSGLVVTADAQTQGRGRQGRVWEDKGGNLFATLGWHIDPFENPGDYSLMTAVSMRAAIQHVLPDSVSVSIKWPNDILLNGRKVAGILIERPEPNWLLIGTGVNVAHAPEGRACLMDFLDVARADSVVTREGVLSLYLAQFAHWATLYRQQGRGPICSAWMDGAFGLGQTMNFRLATESFTAVFRGLSDDGAARAELPDGTVRLVYSGEVFFGGWGLS